MLEKISSLEKQMKTMIAKNESQRATNEMQLQECTQKISSTRADFINKDLTVMLEKAAMTEKASLVVRGLSSDIEKSVSSTISELFQRVVGDKVVADMEKLVTSKETAFASQIQAQLQAFASQIQAQLHAFVMQSPQVEKQVSPSNELNGFILDRKFEEAFSIVKQIGVCTLTTRHESTRTRKYTIEI